MATIRCRLLPAVLSVALLVAFAGTPSQALRVGALTAPMPASTARLVSATPPDPGSPGPLGAGVSIYDFGDTALRFPGFPGAVEDRAVVWRPVPLRAGPHPLIILLHGRHQFCVASDDWPCAPGDERVRSYRGYDYMARNLASHGYIVASISANGINAADAQLDDGGADARGRLILHHLNRWRQWSTTGGAPYGSLFVDKVDLGQVGLMGHSRGGEGVAYAIQRNQALGSPYGIKAAMLIGPVDFTRRHVHGVHLGVILPYCDGDVSDLEGVHYIDDTLYEQASDPAYRNTVLIEGANHNYFNTEWTPPARTGNDDVFGGGGFCDPLAAGNGRLRAAGQRLTGTAYVNGFLRRFVGGEVALTPFFNGTRSRPPSIAGAPVLIGYHPPSSGGRRRDLNRMRYRLNQYHDDLGGDMAYANITHSVCGGPPPQVTNCAGEGAVQDPHSGAFSQPGLTQLALRWATTHAFIEFAVAAGRGDVHQYGALVFRAGVNWSQRANVVGRFQDMRVAITDTGGHYAIVPVSEHSRALRYPPGQAGTDFPLVPKLVLNTVRIPLSAFAGVDLRHVDHVKFVFDRSKTGAIDVANVAFVDPT